MRKIKLVVLGLALATLSSCNVIGDDVCNTSEFEVVNIIPLRSKDNYPRPTTTTYNIMVWDDCLQKNIVYVTPYVSRLGFNIGDTVYNTQLKAFYKQTK